MDYVEFPWYVLKQWRKEKPQSDWEKVESQPWGWGTCQTEIRLQKDRAVAEAQRQAGIHCHSMGWMLTLRTMAGVGEGCP